MTFTSHADETSTAPQQRRYPNAEGPATAQGRGRHRRGAAAWIVLGMLAVVLTAALFPFALAAMNAVKSVADYTANGPTGLPRSFDLTALFDFWQSVDYPNKLLNSILISSSVAVVGTVISLLNAYALGIGRIRGGKGLLVVLLLATVLPQEALAYPLYYLSKAAGLFDSRMSVVVVFAVLHSAFGTYLLSAMLTAFPAEVVEAARMDGANRWQLLWRVIVPIIWPALGVLMTFFFIWTWNEFFLPLILLPSNDNQTVSVAMGSLQGQYTSSPTTMAAAALLGIAPAVGFFLLFQRTLTRGTVAGAVK